MEQGTVMMQAVVAAALFATAMLLEEVTALGVVS